MKIIKSLVSNFKARRTAQPFDIWKEQPDNSRKRRNLLNGYWVAADGVWYYGHPWGTFFKSNQKMFKY